MGQGRHPTERAPRSTHCVHLHLRSHLSEAGQGCGPRHACLQYRSDEPASPRDRKGDRPGGSRRSPGRPGWLAHVGAPCCASKHHHHRASVKMPGARECLGVHAGQLTLQPRLQILRRPRRSLLWCMEQARRPARADHVPRIARMGIRSTGFGISPRLARCRHL
jgi:hypothetical protein